MIQLEKLKYVPLNSFFAFDKENYFTNLANLKLTRVLHIQFIHNQYSNIFHPLITKQHRNKTIN